MQPAATWLCPTVLKKGWPIGARLLIAGFRSRSCGGRRGGGCGLAQRRGAGDPELLPGGGRGRRGRRDEPLRDIVRRFPSPLPVRPAFQVEVQGRAGVVQQRVEGVEGDAGAAALVAQRVV